MGIKYHVTVIPEQLMRNKQVRRMNGRSRTLYAWIANMIKKRIYLSHFRTVK